MCAQQSHGNAQGPNYGRSREVYLFHEGPEDVGGFVHDYGDLSEHFTPGQFSRLARNSANLHAEIYRQPGYIPAPIYQRLPVEGGAGGTRSLRRRDRFNSGFEAAEAAMKAAWKIGREWARLPNRVNRHIPKPEAFAVWSMVLTCVAWRGREEIGTPPPAPSLDDDPYTFLRDGFRLAAKQAEKGRPLSEVLG